MSADPVQDLATRFREGRLNRRQLLQGGLALGLSAPAAIAFLEACSGGAGAGTASASTKSKITIQITQEPTSLDPTRDATASIATLLLTNVYEPLVRLDETGKVVPGLARSWEQSSDGRTLTFHLAGGVKWHDGTAFTARDVKWSYERAADRANKNPHADYWGPMQSIDAVDDKTVRITLKSYSYNFLFHMTAGSAAIMSQQTQPNNATSPVGTGPFKFSAWNKQQNLLLTRNDSYWGTKARLKDVEFRFISDANAQNNALRAGDVDVLAQPGGPEQAASFKQDPNFAVLEGAPLGKFGLYMNNARLKDVNLRKAIYAAIDRQAWIDGIQSGYGVPIGSHAVPNNAEPYYVDENSVNPHDVNKAKQLLQQAGAAGLTLTLAEITDFPYAVRGTDIVVSQLKDAGITVKVNAMQFSGWLKNVFTAKDYDLTIINHIESRDIANYGNPNYYWGYNNPQVADWLKQADAEPDESKRNALYANVQKTIANDAVHAWTYSAKTLVLAKKNLKSFPVGIETGLHLADTHFS